MKTKKMYLSTILLTLVLLICFLAGCGESETQPEPKQDAAPPKEVVHDPVKLIFFNPNPVVFPENQFKEILEPAVKKKYPYISMEYIEGNGTLSTIAKLLNGGTTPDIIAGGASNMFAIMELGLAEDAMPLIKKHNFDLSRLDDQAVNFMKNYSPDKTLYSLPMNSGSMVLFYNKDIFDKFGVPYPKDFMTWDQTYDLAKRVTRDDGGIHYKGIDIVWTTYFNYNQLGLSYVDPKTEKATVNTSDWKSLFDPLLKLYTIPGNEFDTKKARDRNIFLKDRNLAMFVNSDIIPLMDEDAQKTLNWDLSTLPVFDKSPKTGSGPFPNNITVTATSKHKDEAFLVVDTLLSDEVQGMRARKYGVYTALKKQSVKDEYMKDVAYAKGKNTAAFSKLETAPPRNITRYDADANNILGTALEDVLKKKKDINTGLREAEEAVNKKIETVKATDK